jgi:hypothetical protein
MTPGISQKTQLPPPSQIGPGVEGLELEGGVVQQTLRLRIGREQNLKTAVEEEAIHEVCADAAAHGIGGVAEKDGASGANQGDRRSQPGKAGADDEGGRAIRHG